MKISRYIEQVQIDDETKLIYNPIDKQYFRYKKLDESKIKGLLQNLNKGVYSKQEIEILKELINKKIVLSDKADEFDEMMFKENQIRYESDTFHIMIIVTNGCNFRCLYCIQEHESIALSNESASRILKLIENKVNEVKKVKITWFGGEPLLQYKRIKEIMEKAIEIGEKYNCQIEAAMVSNGYLLNEEIILDLKKLNFNMLQITVDGDKNTHDKRRFLANGDGTYNVILQNVQMIVKNNIPLLLRINVDETNFENAYSLLEEIPKVVLEYK